MRAACIILATTLCATAQASDLFKCTDVAGKVTWQDRACDAESRPVPLKPANGSTKAVPQRDYKLESLMVDERERARDREFAKFQRDHQAFVDNCRSIAEEAQRETAWLKSVSDVVRESAAIRIQQLQDKHKAAGC